MGGPTRKEIENGNSFKTKTPFDGSKRKPKLDAASGVEPLEKQGAMCGRTRTAERRRARVILTQNRAG